jgi:hypothetical protein
VRFRLYSGQNNPLVARASGTTLDGDVHFPDEFSIMVSTFTAC